jgi:hypothetical protein
VRSVLPVRRSPTTSVILLTASTVSPQKDLWGRAGAYHDHVPLNARVVLSYELDHSARRLDDALLVQTQVVF